MTHNFGNISEHIAELIYKDLLQTNTANEKAELEEWLQSPTNKKLFDKIKNNDSLLFKLAQNKKFPIQEGWNKLEATIDKQSKIYRMRILRKIAAALIPLIILSSAILFILQKQVPQNAEQKIQKKELVPVLILSDGNKVELNRQVNSFELNDKGVNVQDTSNTLLYRQTSENIDITEIHYHTLHVPNGNTYALQLSDGSKIRLNAGSKLRFPVNFTSDKREVFFEGEGFFEVQPADKPFFVNSGDLQTQVLGTHFNVKAYASERTVQTTLVEGKVKVIALHSNESKILEPNDQASFNANNNSLHVKQVNTANITAWMDGKFMFDGEPLEQVMKQLARWYNISYSFENIESKNLHYSGRISQTQNIESVIEVLNQTTQTQFEIINNEVRIK